MDAPAEFPEEYPTAFGTREGCPYLIRVEGVAKCKIIWIGHIIQVVSGNRQPCSDEQREQHLQDLEDTVDVECPLFIFEDCPGCKAPSVLAQSIDLGSDKSTDILACLLKKFATCNVEAAQLLDDSILSILGDERSIDFTKNRINLDAAVKLVCLMEAATGGRGTRPFHVGNWVCDILSQAAALKEAFLGFLGLLEITFVVFYGETAAQHRKVESRRIWGSVLQILWQHPRVDTGTMGYVVETTLGLLDIERELLDKEHRDERRGMEHVPSFSRIPFNMQTQSGSGEITDLLTFCKQPPTTFPADLHRTDDIHPLIREHWDPENQLDRLSCQIVRKDFLLSL